MSKPAKLSASYQISIPKELRESLGGRVPVERLSWSTVEFGCDGIEVLLGE